MLVIVPFICALSVKTRAYKFVHIVFCSIRRQGMYCNRFAFSIGHVELLMYIHYFKVYCVDTFLITHAIVCFLNSVFGEDALVNISIEKKKAEAGLPSVSTTRGDCKLTGYIRIRSKTQGIALSLGDRITSVQRSLPSEVSE